MDIKEIRLRTKMTQREFGEYFNIPQRTIENWEGGKRNPPEYVVELIKYKAELELVTDTTKEEYEEEGKMLKEKYEVKFDEMINEKEWKYFIVGSQTNLRMVKVVKANTLKELWEDLYEIGEIDIERYESENEIFDEEKEMYYIEEPKNYEDAIKEYLNTRNNFYYHKYNL